MGDALHPSAKELLRDLPVLSAEASSEPLIPQRGKDIEEHKQALMELLFLMPGSEPVRQALTHGESLQRIECVVEELRSRPSTADVSGRPGIVVEELRSCSSIGGTAVDVGAPVIESPTHSDDENGRVSPQGPPETYVPEEAESLEIAVLPR